MKPKGLGPILVAVLLVPLLLGVAQADAKKKKKPKSQPVTVGLNLLSGLLCEL
jgi:hypothetical protein